MWLAAIALVGQVRAQEQRPAYQPMRYEEDWSLLADPAQRTDWLDSLKYIRLGPAGWFATVGGEIREKYELLDQPGFGIGPKDPNGYWLQRLLLASDFHFGDRFRFFLEGQSGLEEGRIGGPRPTDLDRLDFHQGFLDLRLAGTASQGITLRAGRQELAFGTGRLISPAEGLNLRRSLDGLRLNVKKGRVSFNTTALRLVESKPGYFDNVPDHRQTFWGAGFTMARAFAETANLAAYYLGFDNKHAVFAKGVGRETRETIGGHIWKRGPRWDYDYEAVFQGGSFRGAPIRAWAVSEDSGFTFESVPLHPRVGIRGDVTSGDRGPTDRTLRSFDPLFSAVPVWSGPSALLGGINLMDATPSVRLRLSAKVGLTLESSSFWRENLHDSIYTAFNTPLRPANPEAGRYVTTAPSATVAWQADRHTFLSVIYTHFLTGRYFQVTPPNRDVNYVAIWVAYRF